MLLSALLPAAIVIRAPIKRAPKLRSTSSSGEGLQITEDKPAVSYIPIRYLSLSELVCEYRLEFTQLLIISQSSSLKLIPSP